MLKPVEERRAEERDRMTKWICDSIRLNKLVERNAEFVTDFTVDCAKFSQC